MNKRRLLMMLTVLVITILTASGFYLLTGEAALGDFLTVNSTKSGDYEKVYGEGPYTETAKSHHNEKYYIRYTGEKSGRTVVDLSDTDVKIKDSDGNEKSLGGCGLTIKDDYPYIFGQKIESTYKMFSDNNSITRVFIPASVAITSNGISTNTFDGSTNQEIDCVYHTGGLSTDDKNLGSGLKLNGTYDKTSVISQENVFTYVYLGTENFYREILDLPIITTTGSFGQNQYSYMGELKNIYVSHEINDIRFLFSRFGSYFKGFENQQSTRITKVLLDENGQWTDIGWLLVGQDQLDLSEKFCIPNEKKVTNIAKLFSGTNIDHLPNSFQIPENVLNMTYTFESCDHLSGTIKIPNSVKRMYQCFIGAGVNSESEVDDTDCPIVMEYSTDCIPALAYEENIYGLEDEGKVYKKLYDWEIVYDDDGPYQFKVDDTDYQNYYIHYRGTGNNSNQITLDLNTPTTTENKYNVLTKSNNALKIFGIEITSTYKMFSKNNNYDYNDKIYRVFLPACVAMANGTTENGSEKGISNDTFYNTTQDIDCVYYTPKLATIDPRGSGLAKKDETGQLVYDKTGMISADDYQNVTIYVSLDENNINRNDITPYYTNTYTGAIQNVYVNKNVNNLSMLFMRNYWDSVSNKIIKVPETTELKNILIDSENKCSDVQRIFGEQTFSALPKHFSFPDCVENLQAAFVYCRNLEKLPDNFTLPSHAVSCVNMFHTCENLVSLPQVFQIPDNEIYCEGMFQNCYSLSATVKIPKSVATMEYMFTNAGRDSTAKVGNTGCPIVMEYDTACIPALAYRDNIKGYTSNAKVYKELYDWEILFDDKGPYSFEVDGEAIRHYYLHYRGNATTIDLGENSGNIKVSNDVTSIFGINVTSTYRMFGRYTEYIVDSDGNETTVYNNDKLTRVFIPSSIAFKTNPTDVEGIQPSTFEKTEQEIDCIYRTAKLSTINPQGSGLTDTFNKTGIITQNNVITYVSLDNNNMNREGIPADQNKDMNYVYTGAIQNVYVSSDVQNIRALFMKSYWNAGTSGEIPTNATEIQNVLIDENNSSTDLYRIFAGQTFSSLPSRFRLPNNATSLTAAFTKCLSLETLPEGFKIPDKVTSCYNLFVGCESLKGLPASFSIPNNAINLEGMFNMCTHLSATVTIPYNVKTMVNCFAYAGTELTSVQTPITMKYYDGCTIAEKYDNNVYSSSYPSGKVIKVSLGAYSGQSFNKKSQPVVVSDDSNSTQDASHNDKIVIEDETDYITVIVNKKSVDEVVTETQATSQSVENVESESKEDEVENNN